MRSTPSPKFIGDSEEFNGEQKAEFAIVYAFIGARALEVDHGANALRKCGLFKGPDPALPKPRAQSPKSGV
jgi:hypothetical protein